MIDLRLSDAQAYALASILKDYVDIKKKSVNDKAIMGEITAISDTLCNHADKILTPEDKHEIKCRLKI